MRKTFKKYVHPNNFLSNLDKKDRRAVQLAARRSNVKIYFEEHAFDGKGMPLKDMISVFSHDMNQDHSDLWCEYNYLIYLAKKGRINEAVNV